MGTIQQAILPMATDRRQARSFFGLRNVYHILLRATRATNLFNVMYYVCMIDCCNSHCLTYDHSLSYDLGAACAFLCPIACSNNTISSRDTSWVAFELEGCAVEHIGDHIALERLDPRVVRIFVRPEA